MQHPSKYLSTIIGFVWFTLPQVIFAQTTPVPTIVNSDTFVNSSRNAALLPISIDSNSIGQTIFVRAIRYGLVVGAILSISYIIYNSIQLSTAAGDEAKIEQAKRALIWSIAGTAVIVFAFAIIVATQQAARGKLQ